MKTTIEKRGAQLALEEAVKILRKSVHTCGIEEGKRGDGSEGVELADRILNHRDKINEAYGYWLDAHQYYIEVCGS